MEDVVINGYTQVLLGAIGTALVGALGIIWSILWKVIKEKDDVRREKDIMADKHQEKYIGMVDRYHNLATTFQRSIVHERSDV